jgi:hypothetical protein
MLAWGSALGRKNSQIQCNPQGIELLTNGYEYNIYGIVILISRNIILCKL